MGGINMNENIDLIKILEGCPEGTELYSPLFGCIEFVGISDIFQNSIITKCQTGDRAYFSKKGLYFGIYEDAECLIFPSKNQRDWSKFERFWDKPKIERFNPKTFQPFDKMLIRRDIDCLWVPRFFGYMDGLIPRGNDGSLYPLSIPYNDETKHLVGTKDDCPEYYKWWED